MAIRIFIAALCLASAAPALSQSPPPAPVPKPDPTTLTRRAVRAVALPAKAGPEPIPIQPTTAAIRDRNARLQIFLDRQQFGPGKIDGSTGLLARQACER